MLLRSPQCPEGLCLDVSRAERGSCPPGQWFSDFLSPKPTSVGCQLSSLPFLGGVQAIGQNPPTGNLAADCRVECGPGPAAASNAIVSQRPAEGILMSFARFYVLATNPQPRVKTKGILGSHMVWSPQPEEGLTSVVASGACCRPGHHGPDPSSQLPGPSKVSLCSLDLAERTGVARTGRPRGCLLVRGLKRVILNRPAKVERTRKRSEGFTPDRKVEKKKGEASCPGRRPGSCSLRSLGLGRGRSLLSPQQWSGRSSGHSWCGGLHRPLSPGHVFSPGHRTFRGGKAAEAAQ